MQHFLCRDAAFFFCDAESKLNSLVYSAVQHDDSAMQHEDSAVQNCRSRPPRWKSSDPPDGKAQTPPVEKFRVSQFSSQSEVAFAFALESKTWRCEQEVDRTGS